MKIFIPTVGTKLVVVEPWTFTLHDEYRNFDFWTDMTGKEPPRHKYSDGWSSKYAGGAAPIPITIPIATILQVDRIYIRKGNSTYDSISFKVLAGSPIRKGRFWVKLHEVNELNVVLYEEIK